MPPHRGLLAAAAAPIAAVFFVSSPHLQTGPVALTSLLTLVALSGRAELASTDYVLLGIALAVIVGGVRVVVSLFRWGRVAHIFSQPVLRGFVLGAAVLILSSQLPSALGADVGERGLVGGALYALGSPSSWETEAVFLSLMAAVLILGGRRFHPRFPGVLVAMVAGLSYSLMVGYDGATIGTIERGQWGLPGTFPWDEVVGLLIPGVVIAVVAFGEALSISQVFADEDGELWDANREFMSQGVANLASASVGAFPVGGSFSRSSLNRLAGGQSRWSGGVAGLGVILFLPFSGILEHLPKALLGATVIAAILSLLDPRPLLSLLKQDRVRGGVGVLTFTGVLFVAPRVESAIVFGAVVNLFFDWKHRGSIELHYKPGRGLRATGYLCFITVGELERCLNAQLQLLLNEEDSEWGREPIIDVSELRGLDATGRGLLEDVLQRARRRYRVALQAGTT
jgi:SulP family sulfate permease